MDAWPRCLERLEAEFPAEDVHTWLKPLQAEERADSVVLYAPNAFIVEQVRDRYLARIRARLRTAVQQPGEDVVRIGDLEIDTKGVFFRKTNTTIDDDYLRFGKNFLNPLVSKPYM